MQITINWKQEETGLKPKCACRIAEEIEERAKDAQGNVYLTIEEIKKQEEARRAGICMTVLKKIQKPNSTGQNLPNKIGGYAMAPSRARGVHSHLQN